MLKIANPREVPPPVTLPDGREGRGFFYIQPESNFLMCCDYVSGLLTKVRAHREANNYPIGGQFESEVEDWYCRNGNGACREDLTGWDKPLVLIGRFVKSIADGVRNGRVMTTPEEAFERWTTCRGSETVPRCPNYKGDKSWGAVSCGACGCSGLMFEIKEKRCPLGKWKT